MLKIIGKLMDLIIHHPVELVEKRQVMKDNEISFHYIERYIINSYYTRGTMQVNDLSRNSPFR